MTVSDTDSFIDEVTEEVRRDRLFGMMKRYGWIAALGVVVLVGGAAFSEYRKAQDTSAAQATGDSLLAALRDNDPLKRAEALALVQSDNAGARAVANLLMAGENVQSGDFDTAIARLQGVVDATDLPLVYRQVATYKMLGIQGDALDIEARRAGYNTLIGPKSELRLLAEEQLALVDIEAKDPEAALVRLQGLVVDAGATPALRRRVSQLIVALGAEPETVPVTVPATDINE